MVVVVVDTETTNLEKPFCYNVGYVIVDTESKKTLTRKDFVVEQIWHNLALFSSAYYADKRPLYVSAMKGKRAKMDKWGYICKELRKDIKSYGVECAYAYNSSFDERVFNFNCEWFKTINPFDEVELLDIRGLVHHFIAFEKDYQDFCEENSLFTETGNYSTTAESLFRYLTKNVDFNEEHTALADSVIECEILLHCLNLGGRVGKAYSTYTSIPRKIERVLIVEKGDEKWSIPFTKRRNYNKGERIVLS